MRASRVLWVRGTRVRRGSSYSRLYVSLCHMRHVCEAMLKLLMGVDGIHGLLGVAVLWGLGSGSRCQRGWGRC